MSHLWLIEPELMPVLTVLESTYLKFKPIPCT